MPKNNNSFTDFFAQNDFSKFFENYNSSPVDMKAFLETQRKNLLAISEAQQTAVEGFQNLARRQTEILSQFVEDNSSIAKQALKEGTPEEKIAQKRFSRECNKRTNERRDFFDHYESAGKPARKDLCLALSLPVVFTLDLFRNTFFPQFKAVIHG